MINRKVFSVTQINKYIKTLLENDFILSSMWVKGEISNFNYNKSGHIYFTLKDKQSAVNVVMFREYVDLLPFMPENGMEVIVCGYISLYEKTGQYQLYAEIIDPVGAGELALKFEKLKKKLEGEGYFDIDYKREICQNPKRIVVITSPTGAAVRDIIKISKRRNMGIEIFVVPVLVQGDKAAKDIVRGIKLANEWGNTDTIILGRGGGSFEDLNAFNDEEVAKAIFASKIPVISAVGHEIDFTIADFVADLRASTPSAAAELAVGNISEFSDRLFELEEKINMIVNNRISSEKQKIYNIINTSVIKRPRDKILNMQIYLENLEKHTSNAVKLKIKDAENYFISLINRLEENSPIKSMGKGFFYVTDKESLPLNSSKDISVGDEIGILFTDGKAKACVTEVIIDEI